MSGENKKRLLCRKQPTSEVGAGPQLFKYFIANEFHGEVCSPPRRLGFLLGLLLELSGCLGFSRSLGRSCRSPCVFVADASTRVGLLYNSLLVLEKPVTTRLCSVQVAGGEITSTPTALGVGGCFCRVLVPLYCARPRPQMLFTFSDTSFN